MATINVRISSELEKKLEELQNEISKNLPRGAEVTMSSLVRGALEKLIDEHEEEKKFIITTKTPLLEADEAELKCLKELKIHESLRVTDKFIESEGSISTQKLDKKIEEDQYKINFALNRLSSDKKEM